LEAGRLDASNRAGFVAVRSVTTHADSSDEVACLISDEHAAGDRHEISLRESDERIDEMRMALGPRSESAAPDSHVERSTGLAARDALAQEARAILTDVGNQAAAGVEHGDRHGREGFRAGVSQAVRDDDLRICEGDHVGLDVVGGDRRWPRQCLRYSDKLNW
jgi:hypothetical protein